MSYTVILTFTYNIPRLSIASFEPTSSTGYAVRPGEMLPLHAFPHALVDLLNADGFHEDGVTI